MLLQLAIGIAFLTLLIVALCNARSFYLVWKYPKLKSLFYVPLIGHLGFLKYSNIGLKELPEFFERICAEGGTMIFFMGIKLIGIYKPHHMEVVLKHPHSQQKSYIYKFFGEVVKNSLLLLNGGLWRQRRKLLNPLMQHGVVGCYTEDVNIYAEKLVDFFRSKPNEMFDAAPAIAKNNWGLFLTVLVGVTRIQDSEQLLHHINILTSHVVLRFIKIFTHWDFIFKLTKESKLIENTQAYFQQILPKFINERKEIYHQLEETEVSVEGNSLKRRKILDHLLSLKLSDQVILNEAALFTVAGFETTSLTISMALLSMAIHPNIQEKVYEEVMDILGEDRRVEHNDISRLVYLKKVINETLRIFPPVGNVARITTDEIEIDGHVIPKNTHIILSILTTHRSPLYWPDPMKFDPERFNDDAVKERHRYAHIPFLGGPRNCFGVTFAMMDVSITLAVLVRKFKWYTTYKSIEEIELEWAGTTKCVSGGFLQAEPR